jgi:hypothetical protein
MRKSESTAPITLPPLTRARLRHIVECPRRFWLQAVARPPWPAAPLPPQVEASLLLGQRFHQVMRRHFAGLSPEEFDLPQLNSWWRAWQRHGLSLPPGRYLPEMTLTVPLQGERLLARFDLLVIPRDKGERALIVDWKTERRPRTREELAADLQTHLYPFVLAEGGSALVAPDQLALFSPDRIGMIYWQANDPANPVRFQYSAAQHTSNRDQLVKLVGLAQELARGDEPPLIDDLTICSRCRFLSYCGRAVSAAPEPEPEEDHELFGDLEPDR